MRRHRRWEWQLLASSVIVGGAIASSGDYALAQINSDNTLGAESSQVTSPTPGTFQIDGGATRGTNLFHSFIEFSVPTLGTASFNNAPNIQNIISRVTGGSVSNIDGLIRANGTANLFLINPNGIIFGSNASLNIGGSFIGSTASSLNFADGTQFSTKDTQTQPLLTVNVPIGLQLGNNPAPVKVQGSNLEVKPNQNLVLVGGEVRLDAGKLTALGGRIELGGLSTAGKVGLNENGSLNFPNNVARSDVFLTNSASVNVRAGGGGFITINARNLEVSGGSKLISGIGKDLGPSQAQVGDVEINASDTVSLLDGSKVENQVGEDALGNAGNIKITTDSLFLSNKAELNASTLGVGNSGQVIINASGSISLMDESSIKSRVYEKAVGNSGGIDITTGNLSLVNHAGLSATTEGTGNGGPVTINASGSISLMDGSSISSRVAENGKGNSGGIKITTGNLSINNAELNASTLGMGNSGQVIINASGSISLMDESSIKSRVYEKAVGNSGGIDITTGNLSLVNHAGLSATTEGTGNGGPVIINASGSISLMDGSYVNSRVAQKGQGNSNGIYISANSLSLTNGATLNAYVDKNGKGNSGGIYISANSLSLSNNVELNANTWGAGNAGPVIIVSDSISLMHDSYIKSRVFESAVGNSGGIDITTGNLSLNHAGLSASTDGAGNAGPIIINASGSISLMNGSYVSSRVAEKGKGNSGDISITAGSLSLTDDGLVNVSSVGQGNPGNLVIKADSIRLENQGKLTAQTQSGDGGNITLQVQELLLLRRNSQISTTAGRAGAGGEGGKITIDTDFIAAVPWENSDITANAFNGKGGTVTINATGVFGMVVRSREDLVSRLGTNDPRELNPGKLPTNDITAISQTSPSLNGVVTINSPDVDPSRGLAELPVEPVNLEVAQGCQVGGKPLAVGFFNTGKGGLAPNPYEPISSSEIWEDVPSSIQRTAYEAGADSVSASPATLPDKIVEAQGWLVNEKGQVVLVAQMPTHSQGGCRLH